MSPLAPSPLEALPPWPGLPPVLVKREDLLPHGGGAKVRRFLAHLAAARPDDRRPLAVLSERGAHTFVTLARLQADGALRRPLVFLEAPAPRTPHAEANRALYAGRAGIRVVRGPLALLGLRWAAMRARPRTIECLGVGGQTPGGVAAAAAAYDEVRAQLDARGPFPGRTLHLLAAASGTLVAGLAAGLARAGARDGLAVALTGPALARRRLRRRYAGDERVFVLPYPPPSADGATAAARAFEAHGGVTLDPRHALRAWMAALDAAPRIAAAAERLVLWVTGPLAGRPPDPPRDGGRSHRGAHRP